MAKLQSGTIVYGNLTVNTFANINGNLILGAQIYAAGSPGVNGQVLQNVGGTGVAWANPSAGSSIFNGTSNVTVLSSGSNVVISVGGAIIANVGSTGLTVMGGISAGTFTGNGAGLTGLPAGYSNVQVATYLPTYTGNISAGSLSVSNLFVSNIFYSNGSAAAFNGLSPITSTGDLIIGNGVNSATRLAIGTSGQVLTSNGTTASWATPASGGVTTISFGSTGLTPATATNGAITVAGTLAVTNGGTGVTTSTGSGNNVLSNSPTLVTPVLGTPASGLLTNCTGYTYANLTGTVPTWNQNTTGTAASLSAVLSASLGGTGVAGTLTGVLYGNGTGAYTVATTAQMLAGVGTVPIANGGTNNGSLAVTAGGVLYTDGSKVVNVGAGTSGQALLSQGSGAPIWGSAGATGTLKNIQYFTASGTYTPTSGTTFVIVEVVGGGGGGGTSGANQYSGGGGGGGGARKKITSAFSGVTVTVGSGGAAASAGGTSSFGSLVSATGGSAGTTNSSGVSNNGGSGGSGSSGDLNLIGGSGFASINNGGGTGGASAFGYGPNPVQTYTSGGNAAGGVGKLYGGGGQAGSNLSGGGSATGGAGAAGIVIVYEYA